MSPVKGYKAFERAGHLECIDIDECLEINPCQTNEICTNRPGGYDCDCKTGLEYNSNRESGMHLMGGTCVVLKFEFQNYQYCVSILKCVDINECENNVLKSEGVEGPCQSNAECVNAFGYYMCHCISGPLIPILVSHLNR